MAPPRPSPYAASPQFRGGRFRNVLPLPTVTLSLREQIGLLWTVLFAKPSTTVPSAPLPVQPLTRAQLLAAPDRSLY
ncbi:hydrolase, partial [Xanthomonas campestris pv. campestris]|nr:hydrolase [Xanthomonas campestris pv. campestris]